MAAYRTICRKIMTFCILGDHDQVCSLYLFIFFVLVSSSWLAFQINFRLFYLTKFFKKLAKYIAELSHIKMTEDILDFSLQLWNVEPKQEVRLYLDHTLVCLNEIGRQCLAP